MTPFDLLRIALATWYVAYVVTSTSGPFKVFAFIRAHLPLGGLTTCIICLSIWAAAALYLLNPFAPVVIDALAIAGAALMLHAYSGWRYASK
jgi:hypothetical protein